MAKEKINISQAINWKKTLEARRNELVNLRDQNSASTTRFLGVSAKEVKNDVLYDVKALDKLITKLSTEIRKVDDAIKHANMTYMLPDYEQDDVVLGEVA
jgi:hypothetical protein